MSKESIRKIVARHVGCDEADLNEGSALGVTAGWDSMTYLNILVELERLFGIELNEESVEKYKRFPALLDIEQGGLGGR